MQKMLEDFKNAMEQQEEMEAIVVLEEDEEFETESETESNNVSILEYPQTPSPLYIENKITLAEMIARGTVVMLPESPQSLIVQDVKPTEGPVSESPSPAVPKMLEEPVLLTCVEDTSLEEPVLEKSEPTTDPLDSDTDESDESIDEKIPCDAEPIPSIETITEDSGEGHVVIIEPATESQPIEDLESHVLAIKANDVDTPRRLPPPPIRDESPSFFLLPPRHRNESKILDFDYKRTEQRWHQKRVKKDKLYDSRIGVDLPFFLQCERLGTEGSLLLLRPVLCSGGGQGSVAWACSYLTFLSRAALRSNACLYITLMSCLGPETSPGNRSGRSPSMKCLHRFSIVGTKSRPNSANSSNFWRYSESVSSPWVNFMNSSRFSSMKCSGTYSSQKSSSKVAHGTDSGTFTSHRRHLEVRQWLGRLFAPMEREGFQEPDLYAQASA
ncbi:unnamed protein product [Cuscuta campestris]|uniref:Uncharacterized protein n=1 Tax=Cuscuta campestris TaxID=132261 RepID=A0A484LX79_9ASTE|nr:unnamed protein product [Cuscuta campestris]